MGLVPQFETCVAGQNLAVQLRWVSLLYRNESENLFSIKKVIGSPVAITFARQSKVLGMKFKEFLTRLPHFSLLIFKPTYSMCV